MSRRKQLNPKALKDDEPDHVTKPKDQLNCDNLLASDDNNQNDDGNCILNFENRRKILRAFKGYGRMKLEATPAENPPHEDGNTSVAVAPTVASTLKGKSLSALSLVNGTNDEIINENQAPPSKKKGASANNNPRRNETAEKNQLDDEMRATDSKNFHNSSNDKSVKTNGEANVNNNNNTKNRFENGSFVCPLCDEVMTTSHDFTIHIRQHNPNDHSHTCRLCGKTLSSASSLDRHMLVHSGERPFKCRLCTMAFTTNGNMHRHMRTHGEDAEQFKKENNQQGTTTTKNNKHSNKRKSDANEAPNKKVKLENQPKRCPICDKSFNDNLVFEEHMELHPNDPLYCKECNGTFSIYSAYRDHNCKGALTGSNQPNRYPGVGFQDLSFVDFSSNKFSLIAKSVCESDSRRPSSAFHAFECEKCDKSFPCASALRLHSVTHTDPRGTYCATCECDFLTPQNLQTHQLKHRMTEQCGDINLTRDLNNKTPPEARKEDFLAVLQLKNNDTRKIPKIKIKKDRTKENNFENVSYFVHGKPEPPNLGKEGHPESSDFADIQSIISVTSKSPLVGGIRASPVVATPASPLQVTSSTCVSPESPMVADSANASPETPSKDDSEHSSVKGSEDADTDGAIVEGYYGCKLCAVTFKKLSLLKRHNRIHTQSFSSYSCSMCDYNSTDKSTLIRHLRTHNGERPFQCVICKYAFTTKANCERHVRKRHKKFNKHEIRSAMQYNPNMGDQPTEALPPEISGSETICKYCTVDFKSNRVLRHHLRSLHNSCRRKPFFCTLCKLGFSTKNNCIRHVAKQHPEMKEKLRDIVTSNNSQSDCSDMESGLLSDESPSKWDSSQNADSNHNWDFGSPMQGSPQPPQRSTFDLPIRQAPTDLSKSAPQTKEAEITIPTSLPMPLPLPLSLTRAPVNEDQPLNLTVTALCLSAKPNNLSDSTMEDMVSVAKSLVSLSEVGPPPQDEPLDLAVHALDLTVKLPQTRAMALTVPKVPKPFNIFRRMPFASRPPQTPTLRIPFPTAMPNLTPQPPVSLLVRNRTPLPLVPPSSQTPIPPRISTPTSGQPMIPLPVNHINLNGHDESSYRTFKIVNDRLSPRNQRSFSCVYCSAGFTLKSNMERHIKRKHPEFARPTRSRNFIPTLSPTMGKNTVQTLSNKTRDALRVVLTSKAGGSASNLSTGSVKDNDKSGGPVDLKLPTNRDESSLISECSNAELSLMSVSSAGGKGVESAPDIADGETGDLVIECNDTTSKSDTVKEMKETPESATDLASVSSLIDTANSQQFQRYLNNDDNEANDEDMEDDEDEDDDEDMDDDEDPDEDEELKDSKEEEHDDNVQLESCSDNQSSPSNSGSTKKRSSYMDSPNSVACPYCTRKFPWTSSLRRHILTHTGQKPFKCPRCPIWFTTKSNCERHLMRKHGQNSDILSRTVPDRPYKCNVCPSSTFSTQGNLRKHYYLKHWTKTGSASTGTVIGAKNRSRPSEPERYEDVLEGAECSDSPEEGALPCSPDKSSDQSDQPYRCHLCEAFFDVRKSCLSHLEVDHPDEYKLLIANSPPDMEESEVETTENNNNNVEDRLGDDGTTSKPKDDGRKVRCVFCTRKFWSSEDLRRHVRTHSGERPYTCDVCDRTFSLKHSMIRHRRKHSGKSSSAMAQDSSDDDCSAPPPKVDLNVPVTRPKKQKQKRKPKPSQNTLLYLINQEGADEKNNSSGLKNNKDEDRPTDLIQNLLGIQDSSMIDQMLDSADSAARLLGVQEV